MGDEHELLWAEMSNKSNNSTLCPMSKLEGYIKSKQGPVIKCKLSVSLCTMFNETLTYVCEIDYDNNRQTHSQIFLDEHGKIVDTALASEIQNFNILNKIKDWNYFNLFSPNSIV